MASVPLLAVDGTNILYSSHYALARSGLTHAGRPVWAVHGLLVTLARLTRLHRATSLVVAFDSPGGCPARRALMPAYKQTRKPPALDLAYQLEWGPSLLESAGIPTWRTPGWEADDGLASAAAHGPDRVVCASSDRDIIQLIDGRVTQSHPDGTVIDSELVMAKYGVTPQQYAHLAALRGEPSDNLPGVPGIGAKSAAALVKRFGTLDGILAASDHELRALIGPKAVSAIREHGHSALTCLQVGTLRSDLPVAPLAFTGVNLDRMARELHAGGLFRAADALAAAVDSASQLSER